MRQIVFAVSVMLALAAPALAAEPEQPESVAGATETTASGPKKITMFRAGDRSHGMELWASDGTAAGTYLVKDIKPGKSGSDLHDITPLDSTRVLFRASDGTHGSELWISDGTEAGTFMVKDINPGGTDSGPHEFISLGGGLMLFRCFDGTHGQEPWITDGTAAGTRMVKDINPSGTAFERTVDAFYTALGNGQIIFRATDTARGFELWVTDGTTAGTNMVKDINPGKAAGDPRYMTALGDGRALFSASDGVHGYEVWVTDGTSAGTKMVKNINPGAASSNPTGFAAIRVGKAVFAASDGAHGQELWVTDGTAGGTKLLADINPGLPDAFAPIAGIALLGNGKAVFAANDGVHGVELGVTDGTVAGTRMIKDINPGANGSLPHSFVPLGNGIAIFGADDGAHGIELWMTDGTPKGTKLLADINPGPGSSDPGNAGASASPQDHGILPFGNGGRAVFSANDGTNGFELWITNVNNGNTELVDDINPGSSDSTPSSFAVILAPP